MLFPLEYRPRSRNYSLFATAFKIHEKNISWKLEFLVSDIDLTLHFLTTYWVFEVLTVIVGYISFSVGIAEIRVLL